MVLDINYTIGEDLVKNFSDPARTELISLSEEITKRLAKEASKDKK